ncbi:MAG: RidA family protein [Deinococcales bacterium]
MWGYSRAVRIGNLIEVAGTTAVDARQGEVVGLGDAYLQSKFILEKIARALTEAGGSLEDVIRSRIYLTNINDWQEVGRAHGEVFAKIKPASTMLEVSRLVRDELLVEIEVSAYIS